MPNQLVDHYRSRYPDESISDQSILGGFVRQHGEAAIKQQYPDAYGQFVKQRRKEDVDLYNHFNPPGIGGEAWKSVKRTTIGLGETALGGAALGADVIGWEGGRDWLLMQAMGVGESASDVSLAAAEGEWEDVDGLYEGLLYSSSVLGEAVPSLVESLGVAAAGALVGSSAAPGPGTVAGGIGGFFAKNSVKNLLKKEVRELVRKNLAKEIGVKTLTDDKLKSVLLKTALSGKGPGRDMVKAQMKAAGGKLGGTLATTLNSYGLSSGEIYNSLASNPNVDPDDAMDIALVGGLVAAVPDTFLPSYIMSRSGVIDALAKTVKGKLAKEHVKRRFNGYVGRLATQAAITIPAEGATEGFQELVNIAAEKYGDKTSEHYKQTGNWFAPMQFYSDLTDDEKGRIDRAVVVGAAAGGLGSFGAAANRSAKTEADTEKSRPDAPDIPPPSEEVLEEIYSPTEEEKAKIIELIQRELAGDEEAKKEIAASGIFSNRILLKFYLAERKKALDEQGFRIESPKEDEGKDVDEEYVNFIKEQIKKVNATRLTPKIKKYLLAQLVEKLKAARKGARPDQATSLSMAGEEVEVKSLLDEQLGLLEPQPEEEPAPVDDDRETVGLLPESTGAEAVRNRERDEKWQQEDDARESERLRVQKSEDEKKLELLNERLRKAREASVQREGERRTAETALASVWKARQDADKATEQAAKNLQRKQEQKEAKEKKAAEKIAKQMDAEQQAEANEKEAKEEEKKQGDPVNASHVADEPKSSLADKRLSTPKGVKVRSFLDITSDIWDRLKDELDALGNILTQRAGKKKDGKGLSKRDSRRITALLDPDTGEVYAAKTWKEGGEVWVAAPDSGKLKLKTALEQGYVPVASILTTADANVKDYTPFANRNDFDAAFAETIAKAKAEDSPPASTDTETRQRPVQPETSREEASNLATKKKAKALFDAIIRAAVARGLNIEIFETETAKMEGEYGAYANAYQMIRLALADAASPSSETIRVLLHEVAHAVFANESVHVREAIHRAINNMSDKSLQLEGFTMAIPEGVNAAEVVQEERLAETTSINLQQEGFDPTEAQKISQKLTRFFKDIYYRAAMAVQRASGLNIANDELPLLYFQNRMRMFLAGDKDVFSYLSFLGGPKLNIVETIGISRKVHDSSIDMDVSFRDMTLGHPEVIPDNVLAARLGIRLRPTATRRTTSAEPIVQEGEDYDSVQMKRGEVFTLKLIDEAYRKMYEAWRISGAEAMTYEEWLASDLMGQKDPAAIIAEINIALEANGHEQINPEEVTSTSLDQRKQLPLAKEAAYRKIVKVRATLQKNFLDSQENLDPSKEKSLAWKVNKAKEKLLSLVQKYTDADVARRTLQRGLIAAVKELRDDIRQIANASRKKGELYQIIKQLEGKTPDAKAYAAVERKLLKLVRESRSGKGNFFDMMEAAAQLLQDRSDSESRWQTLTASQIVELFESSGIEILQPLVKDRQMLAAIIAMAKKDSLIMDLLSLRRDRERGGVDELLREVLAKGRADEATIRHATRRLPRLEKIANRLLLDLNKKQSDLAADERQIQKQADRALFWDSVAETIDDQMGSLEDDLGIETADRNVQAFALYDGAKIPVPASENTSIEDLKDPTKLVEISIKAGKASQDNIRKKYEKIKRWLIANADKPKSATYRQMERIANELAVAGADLMEKGVKRTVTQKILDSFSKSLFSLDSGIARLMGRRIERFQGEWERMDKEAELIGTQWTLAEKNLMDELMKGNGLFKIDERESFRTNWYQSALQFFEKRPDLLAFSKDSEKMRQHAYSVFLAKQSGTPELKAFTSQPKVRDLFARYMDATAKSSGWFDSQRKRLNIKLATDKQGGYLRDSIGEPIFTVMRRLSDHASLIYETMRTSGWLEVKSDEPFDDSRPLFSKTVWMDFLGPIVRREGRTMLASVQRADGIDRLARRSNIVEAYEATKPGESGFYSIQQFAEKLYSLEEGDPADMESRQQFIEQTFSTLNDIFLALHSQKQELAQTNNDGNMGVPLRVLMDTRKAEELPAEFMEHVAFDSRTMKQMAKVMAMEAQYGRNMSTMITGFNQLLQELGDKAQKYKTIVDEVISANPTATRGKRKKLIEKAFKDRGLNYLVYNQAANNLKYAQDLRQSWLTFATSEGHVSTENRMAQEVAGTMAGATVQGFSTLILDLSAPVIQGQTKMTGIGGTRFAASIYKKAFGEVLGSFWQLFGKTFGLKADNARRRARNGYIFADAHIRMQDQFIGALNEANQNDRLLVEEGDTTPQMLGKRVRRGMLNFTRIVRTLIGSGFGKSKLAENDAAFSTVKPQAPYTWGSEIIHAAAVDSYVEKFESLLSRAVEYLQKAENQPELTDPTFAFSTKNHAKDLGFGKRLLIFDSSLDLDYFLNALSEKGLSLEQLAKEYIERSTTDPEATLITDNNFHHLAALANKDIMLANNVTTQAKGLLSGKVFPVLQNLLGWSIRRTGDLFRMFRKPDGSKNTQHLAKALMRLAFITTPTALGWAVLRDWWDEDIYGKTPNVLKFRDAQSEVDVALTLLDRTARVGVAGLGGDAINGILNVQTGRGFSLDSRIFVVNSFFQLSGAMSTAFHQKGASYETVWRKVIQAGGGSGFLQNFVTYKNFLETVSGANLDTQEDRIVARINIENIIRAAGRGAKNLDVRAYGKGTFLSNPIRPHIKDMITAAYGNDAAEFNKAYRQAVEAAKAEGKADPRDSVARSFGAYNPLRKVFKTDPTEAEYAELLGNMGHDAARTVKEGLVLYNRYGEQIGSKPFFGRAERKRRKPKMGADFREGLPTLDDYRLTATMPIFR